MLKVIRCLSVAIMIAACVASYATQRHLFLSWHVDTLTATIAPVSVDLLAVLCSLALHLEGIARKGRRAAMLVLIFTVGASTSANFVAGETLGSKLVHAGMVMLYMGAEWVASTLKSAEPVKQERRKCEPGCTCNRHNRPTKAETVKPQPQRRNTTARQIAPAGK